MVPTCRCSFATIVAITKGHWGILRGMKVHLRHRSSFPVNAFQSFRKAENYVTFTSSVSCTEFASILGIPKNMTPIQTL